MSQVSSRVPWIDWLRVLALALVVTFHVSAADRIWGGRAKLVVRVAFTGVKDIPVVLSVDRTSSADTLARRRTGCMCLPCWL